MPFVFDGHDLFVMNKHDCHKYLGKKFSGDVRERSLCNLNYRLECAWSKYHANKHVLLDKAISLKLRLKLFNAVVTPTAVFGMVATALTQQQRDRIASTRMQMLSNIVGFNTFPIKLCLV